MKLRRAVAALCLGVTLAFAVVAGGASVPVGVYAVVEKVVVEPSAAEPQRIQIWGTFALWDGQSTSGYQAPARGYLYYSCSKAQIDICRREWADLKSVAGSDEAIGFGRGLVRGVRVRRLDETPSVPDAYPVQFGIVKMGSPQGALFDRLRESARRK